MKIQVLVGMIASGKSTYARLAAQQGMLCINDDAIVNMLHGDDYTLYDKQLKVLYKSIENHIIGTGLAMGKSVLIDRGLNVSKKGRQRWISLAKSFDIQCEAIVFANEGPQIHAQRRFNSDSRSHSFDYWLKVAEAHNSLYLLPSKEEGFDAVHHVSFNEIKQGKVIQ